VAVRGRCLPTLDDPKAADIRAAARRLQLGELSRVALGVTPFATEVAAQLERLAAEGISLLEPTQ
jgi:hypothetical protein